ncbi:hypothetical protein K0M31_003244 [Melipona bicolor]|uniref:NR LBD domain-containing protein n=1 Tax=Melipona bicolor TaxID=60889 RepID=A0AA40FZI4_9HYME|nr:hypothetical protein K0M31_003244 [Melipona bicolor]
MISAAVQHERAPRNTSSLVAAARRGPSGLYPAIPHVYHAASNPYHPLLYPALFPFKPTMSVFTPSVEKQEMSMIPKRYFHLESLAMLIIMILRTFCGKFDLEIDQDFEFPAHFLPRSPTEPLAVNTAKEDEVTSSEEAGPIEARIEPKEELTSTRLAPAIANSSSTDYNVSSFSILPTENIYEFAAKLLFFAVRWARSIHSFLQLPYRDQTILLEESWSELFVLTAAQWNFPVEESALIPNDLPPERKETLVEEVRKLRELLAKCALLRVDHSEYACLKAIVLFKGESRGLCEPGRIAALQEQTVTVFCEREARRVGRLLLLLPPARALCRSTLQELLFKPTVGDVSVERLLGDMVSALRPT